MDLTDRVIEFLEQESRDGKLTVAQLDRLREILEPQETVRSLATTIKVPVVLSQEGQDVESESK